MKSKLQGHQVICSAFIKRDSKILVVFCPRFQVWRVPGGRTEHQELLEETLLREMHEEVGVHFENPIFLGFGQDSQFHVKNQYETSRLIMYYLLETNKQLILDPNEAQDHKWVTLEELKKMKNKEGALKDLFLRFPHIQL